MLQRSSYRSQNGTVPLFPARLRIIVSSALIKLEESIDSTSSIWIALVPRYVKSTAQRLLLATPPHVRLVLTSQGQRRQGQHSSK